MLKKAPPHREYVSVYTLWRVRQWVISFRRFNPYKTLSHKIIKGVMEMKKIIAVFLCILFCFGSTTVMVFAAENVVDVEGPCGCDTSYYSIEHGDFGGYEPIGLSWKCRYAIYNNSLITCTNCGYTERNTVKSVITSHEWVNSIYCSHCRFNQNDM